MTEPDPPAPDLPAPPRRANGGPDGDDPDGQAGDRRQRLIIRTVAAVVAAVLVAVAAYLLLANRHPSRSVEAYCAKISTTQSLSDALSTGDSAQIRAAIRQFHRAAEVAPVDIQAQTEVLVAYADELGATLDTAGPSEAETRAALSDAVRRLQGRAADVVAAGKAVEDYARTNCDFDPTATNGTSP